MSVKAGTGEDEAMKVPFLNRIFCCLLCLFCLFHGFLSEPELLGFAKEQTEMADLRVGLKKLYSGVSSITIKNQRLGMGYCIQDQYVADTEFTSSSGFTFTSARGCYYILNKTYQSFVVAARVAATLQGLGVEAVPVTVYRNYWKVYIYGGSSQKEAETVYKKIFGRFGFTYTFSEDNSQRVLVTGSSTKFLIDAEKKQAYPQFKALTLNSNKVAVIDLGNRQYRGRIEIGRYGKTTLTAVNILYIESYLYGVVSSEIPSSWPEEAQKAQAVCARSYALTKTGYSADSSLTASYKLDDTTSSQVYGGYLAETAASRKAVDATKGEVLFYNGNIIPAYFFSTSGGRTEDAADVWGNSVPYLKGVPDPYEYSPAKEPWIVTYTTSGIAARLSKYQLGVGTISKIYPAITTASGRVYELRVLGSSGTSAIQAGSIREVLGLYSTKFKLIQYGDIPDRASVRSASGTKNVRIGNSYVLSAEGISKVPALSQYVVQGKGNWSNYPVAAPSERGVYYFAGMGYGHGVGLSQSGARGMAEEGFSYRKILAHYYTGCNIKAVGV